MLCSSSFLFVFAETYTEYWEQKSQRLQKMTRVMTLYDTELRFYTNFSFNSDLVNHSWLNANLCPFFLLGMRCETFSYSTRCNTFSVKFTLTFQLVLLCLIINNHLSCETRLLPTSLSLTLKKPNRSHSCVIVPSIDANTSLQNGVRLKMINFYLKHFDYLSISSSSPPSFSRSVSP